MKILVLTFGILVMLSFRACETDTNPTPISETYNLIDNAGNLPIAKQNCSDRCGDLIVPYPFGVGLGTNCSIDKGFDIYCNTSFNPPKAFFLITSQYGWIKNISDSTLRHSNLPAKNCYNVDEESLDMRNNLIGWPYTFSQVNRFTVLGCNDYAWLVSRTESRNEYTGCMVFCSNVSSQISSDRCAGNGCCQSPIPQDMNYYTAELQMLNSSSELMNSSETSSSRRCTYAFVGEEDTFKYNGAANLLDSSLFKNIEENVPVVLDWAVGNMSCAEAKETQGYACQSNSICVDSKRESGGYRCQCKEGYEGNPYLSPGCQDIDECKDSTKYPCYNGYCINTPGNYICNCNKGYSSDATVLNGCQKNPQKSFHQSLLFYLGWYGVIA